MADDRIKLVIAEDNPTMCELLTAFFSMTQEIELCAAVGDGESALKQVALTQPDVLLLDIIMPKLDGLAVLEKLRDAKMEKKPAIIVTSAIAQETITNKVLALGAVFYMIKPYNIQDLLERIRLIAADHRKTTAQIPQELQTSQMSVRTMAAKMALHCGMVINSLGYQYCVGALEIMVSSEERCPIVKTVYAKLAEKHHTTPQCVENALRHAIRKAYESGTPGFAELMRMGGNSTDKSPSNGRFLTILSERIKMEL